jgi:hypothetical protein
LRRIRDLLVVGALALVAPGVVARAAFAQLSAEDHDKARALLADGRSKRAAGDHAAALESFRGAHAIEKLSTTGYEVGRTLADLGRLLEARDFLRDIATAPAADASEPPPLANARVDARQLVDKLDQRIPTLVVRLEGTVDARVSATIDGAPVAVDLLGQPRRLDPGDHAIVIRRGKGERAFRVDVAEAQKHEVKLEVPVDPEESARPAIGKGPADAPTPVARRSYTVAWVAGGIAVLASTAGAVTGVLAANKTEELRDTCPQKRCQRDQHEALESADNLALASTITFIVGGVAAAVAVWDILRTPASPTPIRPATGRALWLGPGGIAGTF